MKKIVLFITFTLCLLLTVGCDKTPQKPSDKTKKPESTTQAEATALERLQDRVADNKCVLGVGFIGYIDSESDEKAVREFVNDSALARAYPFLKGLDEVGIEGSELYAFVPADKAAVITVYYPEISDTAAISTAKIRLSTPATQAKLSLCTAISARYIPIS